jgi:hypothetical protein
MKRALVFVLLLLFVLNIEAKCRRIATVKYQKLYGWSKSYTVEVQFMSGSELNDATESYNYNSFSDYAIIFWGEGKATIIRIKSYTGCDRIVYCDCIDNSIYDYQGFDQDGDKWNICLGDYCI